MTEEISWTRQRPTVGRKYLPSKELLNVGIMALVLLFEFVKLLGEFPVCAGCHFANYLA